MVSYRYPYRNISLILGGLFWLFQTCWNERREVKNRKWGGTKEGRRRKEEGGRSKKKIIIILNRGIYISECNEKKS